MVVGSEKKNLVVLFGEAILALSSIVGAFSVIVKLRIIFGNLRFKLYCQHHHIVGTGKIHECGEEEASEAGRGAADDGGQVGRVRGAAGGDTEL